MHNAQENATHIILKMCDPDCVMFSGAEDGNPQWGLLLYDTLLCAHMIFVDANASYLCCSCCRQLTHHKTIVLHSHSPEPGQPRPELGWGFHFRSKEFVPCRLDRSLTACRICCCEYCMNTAKPSPLVLINRSRYRQRCVHKFRDDDQSTDYRASFA